MQADEEPLDSHVIELADTRPPMWSLAFIGLGFLGEIPMNAGILISMFAGLCFTLFGWKYALWHPFAWYGISELTKNNYHGLAHIQKYIETGALLCLNRSKQGGVSVPSFSVEKNKHRGIAL